MDTREAARRYVHGNGLVFLKDRLFQNCSCRLAFGDRQMCLCPVRAYVLTGHREQNI